MTAVVKMDAFVRVMSGQQANIRVQLDDAAKQVVAGSRKKLHSMVKTIILCGRQNIPLRGHRDSGFDVECSLSVMEISGHCCSFVLQRMLFCETTPQVLQEMQCTPPLTFKIR